MAATTHSTEPIIFVVTQILSDQRCLVAIASSHRCIDVTFIHTSWAVKSCTRSPIDLTCQTYPLETVSYASGDSPERFSKHDLIRDAGQNQVELQLSSISSKIRLPLFLTTGKPEPAYHYSVDVRLLARSWAESPDFLADQAYWIRHYQRQVAAGHTYLEGRVADYERERQLASRIEISAGDAIPVNMDAPARRFSPGCLLIREQYAHDRFRGTLSVVGLQDLSRGPIRRIVRWEEDGVEKVNNRVVAEILDITPISKEY
jgi:hypothetical protein